VAWYRNVRIKIGGYCSSLSLEISERRCNVWQRTILCGNVVCDMVEYGNVRKCGVRSEYEWFNSKSIRVKVWSLASSGDVM
jgi:hypothetical protein